MHLGIERSRGGGIAQRRDGVCVASLPRQRNPQIEERIAIVGPVIQHGTKRSLGLGELLLLQMLPSLREARVGRPRARWRREAPSVTSFSGQE